MHSTGATEPVERLRQAFSAVVDGHSSWDQGCVACAETMSISGGGIVLVATNDQLVSLGCSDALEGVIEEAQFTLGEGPCVDAVRLGVPVHEPDLGSPDQTRWPMFARGVVEVGVAAIFAWPLQTGTANALGAVNFYRDRPGTMSSAQEALGLAVAELAARAVLALQGEVPAPALADGFGERFRALVHQATGMVAAQLDVTVAEALLRLRGHAFAEGCSIDDIAKRVVGRTLRFDPQPE